MNEHNHKQFEMFNSYSSSNPESNHNDGKKIRLLQNEFYTRKFVIGIIIFIVINLLSFSFGVERGLRLTKTRGNAKNIKDTTSTKQESIKSSPVLKKNQKADSNILKPSLDKPDNPIYSYSVQVASYHTMSKAEKEAQSLRKKGYQSFVLKKGSYVVVCVGKFKDKSEARISLNKLKKIYSDSYVRRI